MTRTWLLAALACGLAIASPAFAAVPGPPMGLAAHVNGGHLFLFWSAPAGPVSAYVVEAGSGPGRSNLARITTGTRATTFSAAGVPAGTYYVRVRAVNADGAGAPAADILVVVNALPIAPPCPTVPNAPIVTGGRVDGGQVSLVWQPAASGCAPAGYLVTIGREPGAHDLATVALPATSTSFTGAAVAGQYFLRVQASNTAGRGPASVEVTGTIGGAAAMLAPTPADCFTCHARFAPTDAGLAAQAAPRGSRHAVPVSSHH